MLAGAYLPAANGDRPTLGGVPHWYARLAPDCADRRAHDLGWREDFGGRKMAPRAADEMVSEANEPQIFIGLGSTLARLAKPEGASVCAIRGEP